MSRPQSQDPAAPLLMQAVQLQRRGDLRGALVLLERAAAAHPRHPEALRLLAASLLAAGDVPRAVKSAEQAAQVAPTAAPVQLVLAEALSRAGQTQRAVKAVEAAIRLGASGPAEHAFLGGLLCELRDLDGADRVLDKALALAPNLPPALFHKASVATARHHPMAARAHLERFLRTGVAPPVAESNIGKLLLDEGDVEGALAAFRRALATAPTFPSAISNLLYTLLLSDVTPAAAVVEEHRRIGDRLIAAAPRTKLLVQDRGTDRPLRIGYLSPDLRTHPVSMFLEPVLTHHDRARFHVTLFSDSTHADGTTARLRGLGHAFQVVAGMPDEVLARHIAEARIDVLVDLAVHTNGNRQPVFASRAAPVQVSYLGYAATTGLSTMDARITDGVVDPPGSESLSVERLLRLPDILWCYRPADDAPPIATRPAGGAVRFGHLGRLSKIGDRVIDVWSRILKRVPGAVLVLQAAPLVEPALASRWRDRFAARGIPAERLEFRGLMPVSEYLSSMSGLDVALDPFPFCGGTTTCNALWMGVPVVTRIDARPWSRVSASVLRSLGFDDWIAEDDARYVDAAVALAGDPARRAELRRTLRSRMQGSVLMDGPRVTRAIEKAYVEAWRWKGAK